jgi:hypothetical protein
VVEGIWQVRWGASKSNQKMGKIDLILINIKFKSIFF